MKCNTPPFKHVFEGSSEDGHPNKLSGRGDFLWGHKCLCGETEWSGHHPKNDGREEIEKYIKWQKTL